MEVLWNSKRNFFHLEPGADYFTAFSSPDKCEELPEDCKLSKFRDSSESIDDVISVAWNAGFRNYKLDGQIHPIEKPQVLINTENRNTFLAIQYMETQNESYVEQMECNKLYALCKIDGNDLYLASALDEDTGEIRLCTFTNRCQIPQAMKDYCPDYQVVLLPVHGNANLLVDMAIMVDI